MSHSKIPPSHPNPTAPVDGPHQTTRNLDPWVGRPSNVRQLSGRQSQTFFEVVESIVQDSRTQPKEYLARSRQGLGGE